MTDCAFFVAEMNTAHFIFKGAGSSREGARAALLTAWTIHRREILRQFPDRAAILPLQDDMERHFNIHYFEFVVDGGYRDRDRLV